MSKRRRWVSTGIKCGAQTSNAQHTFEEKPVHIERHLVFIIPRVQTACRGEGDSGWIAGGFGWKERKTPGDRWVGVQLRREQGAAVRAPLRRSCGDVVQSCRLHVPAGITSPSVVGQVAAEHLGLEPIEEDEDAIAERHLLGDVHRPANGGRKWGGGATQGSSARGQTALVGRAGKRAGQRTAAVSGIGTTAGSAIPTAHHRYLLVYEICKRTRQSNGGARQFNLRQRLVVAQVRQHACGKLRQCGAFPS